MKKFYFTFGTDGRFPFYGGWVEVLASDRDDAVDIFQSRFPSRTDGGFVNCAFIYDADAWAKTSMSAKGVNMGHGCYAVLDNNGLTPMTV